MWRERERDSDSDAQCRVYYCVIQVYLLKDSMSCSLSQERVMPVKVLIDLSSLLQVTWVPVIRQLVLAYHIGHDCRTTAVSVLISYQ